jgi:dihydrofolate reductase
MSELRVHNFSMSLDGYAAGPDQGPDAPLGAGGERLHEWVFPADGRPPVDEAFVARGIEGIGATIMGRNMFGPQRGPWEDESWRGWWGDNPPYHHDVFVHTHHLRPTLRMAGGTTFHFTDEPLETVLQRAFDAADGKDVRIGGGAAVIQQYLRAGLIDELHLVIAPMLIGRGERLFDNLGGGIDGYRVSELVGSPNVMHAILVRR